MRVLKLSGRDETGFVRRALLRETSGFARRYGRRVGLMIRFYASTGARACGGARVCVRACVAVSSAVDARN